MAVQPNDVKKIALSGEFNNLSNQQIKLYLDMAERMTNDSSTDVWRDSRDDAVKLLTAHYLTLALRGGSGGSIASEKVGDLSINYGQTSSDDVLATTSYGQMYLQLRKGIAKSPRLACPQ